ncbi:MAG: hypothetical protein CL609_07470 [Anaerolineaceae bacterium]|nr:hypothetical protein [Anaerolineaceae bacterium]
MTQEDAWKNLAEIHKKDGPDSEKYASAFTEYEKEYGKPGRGLEAPGKNTNGGSHKGDSDHFGANKRS